MDLIHDKISNLFLGMMQEKNVGLTRKSTIYIHLCNDVPS